MYDLLVCGNCAVSNSQNKVANGSPLCLASSDLRIKKVGEDRLQEVTIVDQSQIFKLNNIAIM